MSWIYLLIAGLFEVAWATTMKLSHGLTQFWFTAMTVAGLVLSFWFLSLAVRHLPLSLSYPIWTGIGAVGSIIVGVLLFKDQLPASTWFFVALLIIGIVGIKVTSGS